MTTELLLLVALYCMFMQVHRASRWEENHGWTKIFSHLDFQNGIPAHFRSSLSSEILYRNCGLRPLMPFSARLCPVGWAANLKTMTNLHSLPPVIQRVIVNTCIKNQVLRSASRSLPNLVGYLPSTCISCETLEGHLCFTSHIYNLVTIKWLHFTVVNSHTTQWQDEKLCSFFIGVSALWIMV